MKLLKDGRTDGYIEVVRETIKRIYGHYFQLQGISMTGSRVFVMIDETEKFWIRDRHEFKEISDSEVNRPLS